MNRKHTYYFSTRDLLMMAALAALGGVTSTYINALGDLLQSVLGFAGGLQWAAGFHVLWLVLAVGLTRKLGAGTVTGVLKGVVELLSGNTHGLLVVLVDIVAGLLVDIGFLPFRDKDKLPAYLVAGGLASASNVLVFQLFAALPVDILSYGLIVLLAGVAFISGMIFAGLVGHLLIGALRRTSLPLAGRDVAAPIETRRGHYIALVCAVLLTVALWGYLRYALRGPATVHIGGAVAAPYDYPAEHGDIPQVTAESTMRDVAAQYQGVPVQVLIERADPNPNAGLVLVQASDGYAFFLDMDEVRENEGLLLSPQGKDAEDLTYNIVGARNTKAWVRGVMTITVVGATTLEVTGALENPSPYHPDEWQFEMDSTSLDLGQGLRKYQGTLLHQVLEAMKPQPDASRVILYQAVGEPVSLSLSEVMEDDKLRIFTIIDGRLEAGSTLEAEALSFAVARMNGEILARQVTRIEVQ
jgi:energy-coupling factor transport system substrate-specific component